MVLSWIRRLWKKRFRPVSRSARKQPFQGRFLPTLEPLSELILPSVTATFTPGVGVLTVFGDAQDNTITVSRDTAGHILVNGGAISIKGGVATAANTSLIEIFGQAGNDTLSLDETNGALPAAQLFGGAGNDTLIGGSGADLLFGEAGDDVMIWNPGEGSDLNEGGTGTDTVVVNGGNGAENFRVTANGSRVRFDRISPAPFSIDIGTSENLVVNPAGGADTVTVNDLTGTGLTQINVNLESSPGSGTGDGAADSVVVNGTAGADRINVAGDASGVTVSGLAAKVTITGAEAVNDRLTVNALGGNDSVTASGLPANMIGLTVDGGAGNDQITGSDGNDMLIGGDGNDVIIGGRGSDTAFLGAGNDTFVWNPGDGSDMVEGQGGVDTLQFNGSNANENIDLSANGSRLRLFRDVGNVTMDVNGVEQVNVAALGGSDTVTVNDLSHTGVTDVNLDLGATPGTGTGDGAADSVIVSGTTGDDAIAIVGNAGNADVLGLAASVHIAGAEAANDRLIVNAGAGDDVVDASGVAADTVQITADGGDGNDVLIGSAGNHTLLGGAGDDLLISGTGPHTLDGGPGNNTLI